MAQKIVSGGGGDSAPLQPLSRVPPPGIYSLTKYFMVS